jgi:hypothetical protein
VILHHISDLAPAAEEYHGNYPWMQVGVFPTKDSALPERDWFNYTVGLGLAELWVPCMSVEGRAAGNQLVGGILNTLAAAWTKGVLGYGDNVVVPLGIPDADDADSIWWVKGEREPARRRQVNMTVAEWVVPVLWSSPLGWADD